MSSSNDTGTKQNNENEETDNVECPFLRSLANFAAVSGTPGVKSGSSKENIENKNAISDKIVESPFVKGKLRDPRQPPLVPGIPIFGNALKFDKNSVFTLLEARKNYGDVFTLQFPGIDLNLMMNPLYVKKFQNHKAFSFEFVKRHTGYSVFQLDNALVKNAIKLAKQGFKADVLHYQDSMEESFTWLMDACKGDWKEEMMIHFVYDTQFRSVFNYIYGKSDNIPYNHRTVAKLVWAINDSFTFVWLGFPTWLFPETGDAFKKLRAIHPSPKELIAKEDSSAYIKTVMREALANNASFDKYVVGHSLEFLHVNYNSTRICYWGLNECVATPEYGNILRKEIDEMIASIAPNEDGVVQITVDDLDSMQYLNSFVNECYRITSGVFVMRQIIEDTEFTVEGKTYIFKENEKIAVYPPAIHMDPEIFEEPKKFKIDRFVGNPIFKFRGKELDDVLYPTGLVCPAKRLANLQFKWFMFSLLAKFDVRAVGETAKRDFRARGQEVLPPIKDVPFQYKNRSFKNPPLRLVAIENFE